ncbi:WSC domain-containing protein 2-like [Acanthaster planci]|uniref:WSC domain-containing protein 2-like n=1 Tax=Acanthaster planci TaxID=133434 RepID=A0A8B7Z844_ACAPL|nr:WSC domain-containing protein 2-like [Acanthaster planci]
MTIYEGQTCHPKLCYEFDTAYLCPRSRRQLAVNFFQHQLTMWGKRKHRRGWLSHLLPCRTRHRDTTLFKLTVIACLAFPAYILLFDNVSSLGNSGDSGADLGPGAPVRGLARGPQGVPQPHPLRTTQRVSSLLRQQIGLEAALPGDELMRGRHSARGGDWDHSGRKQLGPGSSNSTGLQKIQFIAGTRVLYLGCYQDETQRTLRVLREGFIADVRRMTLAMCIRHCSKRSSYYAGLEFHSECYCGRRIYRSKPANQSLCNATCAGNTSETCGGAPYLSIYQLLADDERGGDQAQQGPWSRGSEGLADDFRACVPRPATPGHQQVFPAGFFTSAPKMTVDSCMTTCFERLFPVAALGAGTECHCGHFTRDFRMENILPHHECNVPCAGDESYYCGGDSTLSVYQTAAEDTRCSNATLTPPGSLPLVALASFPGSGNTWVRYLIERATGVYTGSFYNDGDLFKKGFIGEKEKWTRGNTIAVKTHRFDEEHVRSFQKAILIIRNPYKAIISEHNRKFGGHVGFAPETQYTKGTEWIAFVTGKSRTWANTAVNFIQYSKKLHVVYYEDLQSRLYDVLEGIVSFLEIPVDEERLMCVLSSPHGKFKRSGKRQNPLTFDPYTEEMREMVELSLKAVSMALKLRDCPGLPREYNPGLEL